MEHNNSLVVRVVRMALEYGEQFLPPYSCSSSKHDFTQPQLFACLVYKNLRRLTYRETSEDLELNASLRHLLKLRKAPHYSTLSKFATRVISQARFEQALTLLLKRIRPGNRVAAVDSTGLGKSAASSYYRMRQGERRISKGFVKVSAIVLKGTLIPCAAILSNGPSGDRQDVPGLVMQAQERKIRPKVMLGDAGYDSEKIHQLCREQWKVKSIIPLNRICRDGTARGKYRSQMVKLPKIYGQRWLIETYYSGLKRTTGSVINARKHRQQFIAGWLKILTYAYRR